MSLDGRTGDRSARFDVVVVGGGLSGLVAAHALQRGGHRVAVVEAADRPGGVIATHHRDGFLFETGANSALDNAPLLAPLLGALGISQQRIETSSGAANRYVVRDGRLVALPMTPRRLIASGAFSTRAKLRLLREPFVARAPAGLEESIAAFVRRRLGAEMLDYAVDPFVSGIYAGDPERLSMQSAFPRLHALEQAHGSLLRGRIAAASERRRNGEPSSPPPRSFSFRNGMQTLTDALGRSLAHRVDRTEVTAITPRPSDGYAVACRQERTPLELHARAVIVATPALAAASLVAPHDDAAARALASIVYAPVAIVATAYRRQDVAHALDGFGVLVPSRERRRVLGTLFSSSAFEGRAPPDHALLTTFVGGRRAPDLPATDDAALSRIVDEELAVLLGARRPLWSEIVRWMRAIPQYELGHGERVQRIRDACAKRPGLYLCGSWMDGVSIGDRITSAHAVAEDAAAFLKRPGASDLRGGKTG